MSSWEDAYKTTPPWDVGRPQPVLVELVRARELNKGRVLDVGCGTGENALYLAENGFSVAGVDLSSRAIAAARAKTAERRLRVDFRAGNALSLDFKDSLFDNVIDSGLFHTFTDNDRPVYAREISRVLVTNGKYFHAMFQRERAHGLGRTTKSYEGGDRGNVLAFLQNQLHQGRVVRNAIPQRWWRSTSNICNKKIRLDHHLLTS